jgi:exo-1,4-beta-D-glucosaminidase
MIHPEKIIPQENANENVIVLHKGWFICPAEIVTAQGSIISASEYSTKGWYPAIVPSTVLGALVKDGVYKHVFTGDNLKNIPAEQFKNPWWYRTEFKIPEKDLGKTIKLEFNGIIYSADIWFNGGLIANSDSVKGVYRLYEFNVSNLAKPGQTNVLAIKVIPPVPGDPSVGFVDWNPKPPDNNMGLWREVRLKISGDVSVNHPFIQSKVDLATLKSAELTVSAELLNNTGKNASGVLNGEIGRVKFSKKINLLPNEKKLVTFSPADFPQLKIENPRLWWTYNLGKPELYKLKLKFVSGKQISDISEIKFGIREVSDYINPEGFRGYKLNGKEIQILGGGWVDNLFLNEDYKNLQNQVQYVKLMGLNTIRLEGIWGETSRLFDLCDENGILIMAGWSCQWEWEDYLGKPADEFGGIKSPEDMNLIAESFKNQLEWLRNHPSIFLWLYGSDLIPRPELEKRYQSILQEVDPTRPYLASAGEHVSTITGKTAVKMRGPYDYVPPVYWWIDNQKGGAFGFNTEVGPGAEAPPIESIEKMIPRDHLWPIDSVWNFHCGKNTFSNLNNYNEAIANRLGTPDNLQDFSKKAQFINYENTRAMFEANIANKFKATGVIHWMLNASWPKLWWQLYDYYLMPAGAFFGTKKACEPVHILYDYGDGKIMALNNTINGQNNLTARIRVLNFDLTEKYLQNIPLNLSPGENKTLLQLPAISNLSKTYFIDLKLFSGRKIISSNFYCLSTKPDELDTAKATWSITPTSKYADLTELNKLEKVKLTVNSKFAGSGKKNEIEAEISNKSDKLAFQIVLSVTKGKNGGTVLPVFWEDNYFSLLPGEKRTIKGYFYKEDLNGKQPELKISGWNIY